ncbi:helicase-related protein [Paenibacillus lacisoli]|uniref:helicase-related protein n=1 Tax=Paenibacillus lacisoli TaxID=3064525 RepID=UPI00387E384B
MAEHGWGEFGKTRPRKERIDQDRWSQDQVDKPEKGRWQSWVEDVLQTELQAEPVGRRRKLLGMNLLDLNRTVQDDGLLSPECTGWDQSVLAPDVLDSTQAWERLQAAADQLAALLAGRQLLVPELAALLSDTAPPWAGAWRSAAQLAHVQGRLSYAAGLSGAAPGRRGLVRCRRCGSGQLRRTACAACGSAACAYCEACLALGRSRACALLLSSAAPGPAVHNGTAGTPPTEVLDRWGLSPAQRAAAAAALAFVARPPGAGRAEPPRSARAAGVVQALVQRARRASSHRLAPSPPRFLLWAVTGAGKTEMIFPLLADVLERGGRALVATPRRDVVLELAPRLAKAFPSSPPVTLYGGSPERWRQGELMLATTHQLMRFRHAFDLVIIDELDAFPYHNDPMLAYAAQQACRPYGKFIYLSATPPAELQREAARGRLSHAKVPVRFHRHPLPVPMRITMNPVASCLRRGQLPLALVRALRRSVERGAQLFVFATRIAQITPLTQLLARHLPGISIAGTSSEDTARSEKVAAFRSREIRLLVTTTILERGVTVPKSDVFILDADSSLFDEASLVQMSGRAGRAKDDPAGNVVFASPQWTRGQKQAVAQIKRMNRIARKQGYLRER